MVVHYDIMVFRTKLAFLSFLDLSFRTHDNPGYFVVRCAGFLRADHPIYFEFCILVP
mgnify:CR=1 FL=1